MVKHILAFIGITCAAAVASDVIEFNPTSYPVTNGVVRYLPSMNTPEYENRAGFLVLTNPAAQRGTGVYMTNLSWCVVDGQMVRLTNSTEHSLIISNNTWSSSNAAYMVKLDARRWSSNVVNQTDALSLYLRAVGEANWFYLNYIRTNDGKSALPRATYLNQINIYIDSIGQ